MQSSRETSEFVRHIPCSVCNSSDANSIYTDNHQYCFSCGHHEKASDAAPSVKRSPKMSKDLAPYFEDAYVSALVARQINEQTCQKFGVRLGEYKGAKAHFYPYYKDGKVVAAKVRGKDKTFNIIGDGNHLPVFGQNLWSTGKKIVVTEGEIDCLTVSMVQGNKWPTVSVPNGAQGAKRALSNNLEYFDGFEEVILMFDMDEPGQAAAKECAELFKPGKAKIATLPMKDPNECLLAGKEGDIVQAIWNAKPFRPDGIISGQDLWEDIIHVDVNNSIEYPWKDLTAKTGGIRKGELVTITAGSGIGKSAVVREIAYDLLQKKQTVGMIMLEENPKRTALGLMGIHLNKPLHINKEGIDDEKLLEAFNHTVGSGRLYLYDHFGSNTIDNLISRIRFLSRGCGCEWIIVDHLSIIVSGLGDGDERRLIDNAMTTLRTLVEELGIGMLLVSHLKRPEKGRGHEEGATTSLSQLRGSHAIAQLSDMVIGLERNQQDTESSDVTVIRVLKNRFSGDTGLAGELKYDRVTGRLHDVQSALVVLQQYSF